MNKPHQTNDDYDDFNLEYRPARLTMYYVSLWIWFFIGTIPAVIMLIVPLLYLVSIEQELAAGYPVTVFLIIVFWLMLYAPFLLVPYWLQKEKKSFPVWIALASAMNGCFHLVLILVTATKYGCLFSLLHLAIAPFYLVPLHLCRNSLSHWLEEDPNSVER